MAVEIKEEGNHLIDVNCEDEEFLLPLEDPLAFDDNEDQVKVEVDDNNEPVIDLGIIHEMRVVSTGFQASFSDSPSSIDFKERPQRYLQVDEKRIAITKHPKAHCFICTICHSGFNKKDLFQEHLNENHSDVFKYPCRHCGKKFQWDGNRERHEKIHDTNRFQGEPKFACDKCDQKYHLKSSLMSHIKRMHLGLKYKSKSRTSQPIIEHHAIGVRAPPKERVKKVFQCPKCDLKFDMRCNLMKHMLVHSNVRLYKCTICGQGFKNGSTVHSHIRNVHQNPSSSGIRPLRPKFMSGQPCECKVCGKVYALPSRLIKHMTKHSEERKFECELCQLKFKARADLQRHLKLIHPQNNMFHLKCIICGKEFKQFSSFNQHRKIHSFALYGTDKEKAFGCSICGKPYFKRAEAAVCTVFRHDPSSLLKQMFRFKCNICPPEKFGYHSLPALRNHWSLEHDGIPLPVQYRVGMYDGNGNEKPVEDVLPNVKIPKVEAAKLRETGIPPVKMEHPLYIEFDLVEVEKKFLKRERKHREKKEPKIPERVPCPICPMTFSCSSNLKRHLDKKAHSNKTYKIFKCSECEQTFYSAKKLRLHEKTIHQFRAKRGRPKKKHPLLVPNSETENLNAYTNSRNNSDVEPKRRRGRPWKIRPESPNNSGEGDNGSQNVKISVQGKDGHELQISREVTIHDNEQAKLNRKVCSVNVNDKEAISSILGDRLLKVQISRLTFPLN